MNRTYSYSIAVHIKTLTKVNKRTARELISYNGGNFLYEYFPGGKVIIDYPLEKRAEYKIPAVKSIGELLWYIARKYKNVYKNHKKFGVWGHFFGDLYFEGVTVHKNNTITLIIGS
jgi:hypothetical protein